MSESPTAGEQPRTRRFSLRPEWRDGRLSLVASIKPVQSADKQPQMDIGQSPLTQDTRPEVFEPKVVSLYHELFRDVDDSEHTEGFWRELFLLRPDISRLRGILEEADADYLLHIEHRPRQLLINAVATIKAGQSPSDGNALDTLTAFFAVVLAKKYTNPSSDMIEVLAGLDNIDAIFSDLVATLEHTIRDGRDVGIKQKAVRTSMAVVAGGYQTALISYFIHRDFFPALMKLIAVHDNPIEAATPFLLIGLLANYDKFETASNAYRTRFGDFVNDGTMTRITECVGWTATLLRDVYVAILDDTPAGWSIGGTLNYVGLGSVTGAKPTPEVLTEEAQKIGFGMQPAQQAAILLPLYDFVLSNKVFALHLITYSPTDSAFPAPFSTLLSFVSYLLQHAYRSSRAGWYAYLSTLILYILTADTQTSKALTETTASVRLCRQRPPALPIVKGQRPYTAAIIDIAVDGINHNLRKNLDTRLYTQLLSMLLRMLHSLARARTHLTYHWSELWRSLLSFVRFLTTYASDVKSTLGWQGVVDGLVSLLAFSLRSGETFVPDAKDYDDLVYKLVESGEALSQLRDAYSLGSGKDEKSDIALLIGVSKHYREIIDEKHKGRVAHLSPKAVSKVIKEGYETLSISASEDGGVGETGVYREGEHKASLKRALRVVLVDAGTLLSDDIPPSVQ